MEAKAVRSEGLSGPYDSRYVIVDVDTGEVLDDAQGYGYKTAQKAYAAWGWKNRAPETPEQKARKEALRKWMREHEDFLDEMDGEAWDCAKGCYGLDVEFDSKFVGGMLKDHGIETEFKPGEILKAWQMGDKYFEDRRSGNKRKKGRKRTDA